MKKYRTAGVRHCPYNWMCFSEAVTVMKKKRQAQTTQKAQSREINWQPLSRLAIVAQQIDIGVTIAEKMHLNVTGVLQVFDNESIARLKKITGEQIEVATGLAEQVERWKKETLSMDEHFELMRLSKQCERLITLDTEILARANEQAPQTIEKILDMDDAELGLRVLMGDIKPPGRK